MAKTAPIGQLVISIDLSLPSPGGQATSMAAWRMTGDLAGTIAAAGMSVTWIVDDHATAAIDDLLGNIDPPQDVALLASLDWAVRGVSRRRFASGLSSRLCTLRGAGLAANTLALVPCSAIAHGDLAAKHGITAVASDIAGSWPCGRVGSPWARLKDVIADKRPPLVNPKPMRFALVSLPTSARWPLTGRFHLGTGTSVLRQTIDRAAETAGTCHLIVGASELAAGGRRMLRAWENLLRHAERRRDAGVLWIGSVAETVERYRTTNQGRPARSILRAAA